jgi:uncharacterized SAM-binding protein YcdF (DUF218 family)
VANSRGTRLPLPRMTSTRETLGAPPSGGSWWIALTAGSFAALTGTMIAALRPRDDVPQNPDAVVVLGGAGYERLELGIELSERHGAVLVLSSSAIAYGRRRGLVCGQEVLCHTPQPETTTGEARTLARLADHHGWDHITVATSRFHTTRARVLFRQCLGDRVTVVGARAPDGRGRGPLAHLREAVGTIAALTIRRACRGRPWMVPFPSGETGPPTAAPDTAS